MISIVLRKPGAWSGCAEKGSGQTVLESGQAMLRRGQDCAGERGGLCKKVVKLC